MFWVSLLVTALLIVGIVFVFGINPTSIKEFVFATKDTTEKKVREHKSKKKISIKKQIELLLGNKRDNFVVRSFNEAKGILIDTHQTHRLKGIYVLSAVCGSLGVVLAAAFGNIFLMPTLAIGLALVPTWAVKLNASKFKKVLNSELEVALSGITTSYMRSDNLILAADENLRYLNNPVKQIFTKFVNESKVINSNIPLGITKMKHSLDNDIFHEWCDALIQCQSDRSLKVTLFPIMNKFSETKNIQNELDTLMMLPFKDFITLVLIVILSIPLMYVLNRDWFDTLVGTAGGQFLLSLTFVAIFYGINKAVNLTKPIKHGE